MRTRDNCRHCGKDKAGSRGRETVEGSVTPQKEKSDKPREKENNWKRTIDKITTTTTTSGTTHEREKAQK